MSIIDELEEIDDSTKERKQQARINDEETRKKTYEEIVEKRKEDAIAEKRKRVERILNSEEERIRKTKNIYTLYSIL